MSEKNGYSRSEESTEDFEPFMLGDRQAGEVHWLRQESSSGQATFAGLWRCEPMSFEYEFPGDETFHVLEGSLLIETAGGTSVRLSRGDIVTFDKGIKSTWTVERPFKKFFVISNV